MTKKTMSLESQVKGYWTRRDNNSVDGLALIDSCIKRFAEHGDWDALSRFYVGSLKVGQGPAIARIIRAAFGDKVKFHLDAKHDTGGKFSKKNWPDAVFPLHESNTYSLIAEAVANKQGWDHKVFQKSLMEAMPKEKTQRVVSEESKKAVVKHLMTYTSKLVDDGFNVGEIIARLQKELAAAQVTVKAVA